MINPGDQPTNSLKCPECGAAIIVVTDDAQAPLYEGVFCECGYVDIDVVAEQPYSLRESYYYDVSAEFLF